MSELDPTLARWATLLEPFAQGPRDVVAAQAERLARIIGPMHAPQLGTTGEPDGFDGIAQRGAYERLLTSEWLLADELPDEFVRRAAMHEHSFLAPARREPKPSLTCAVLFDAGPDQLGAPRIAQLALLAVLSRRAAEADAELVWGTLQDRRGRVYGPLSSANASAFIEAHTPHHATPDDVDRWAWLHTKHRPNELWLVGGDALAALTTAIDARRVHFADSPELGTRLVLARATHGGHHVTVELRRAAPHLEVQTLKKPFAPPPVRVVPPREAQSHLFVPARSPIWLSPNGRRLFVRDLMVAPGSEGHGRVPIRWVARKVRAVGETEAGPDRAIAIPKPDDPLDRVLAIGWGNQRLYAARLSGDRLEVTTDPHQEPDVSFAPEPHVLAALRATAGTVPLFARAAAFVFGVDRVLVEVPRRRQSATTLTTFQLKMLLASCIAEHDAGWLVRGTFTPQLDLLYRYSGGSGWSVVSDLYQGRSGPAGQVVLHTQGSNIAIGMVSAERELQVVLYPSTLCLRARLGSLALWGLVRLDSESTFTIAAVVMDPDGSKLKILTPQEMRRVPSDGSRILRVAIATGAPVIAWLTADGELACWHCVKEVYLSYSRVTVIDATGDEA